jgi:hypothetical protein
MRDLGKITNHHLVISDAERLNIINALAFFHAVFDPHRDYTIGEIIADWQPVAQDSHLPSFDLLATRISCIGH